MKTSQIKKNGKKAKYVIFSFFAGAGFLDLGFETSGFNIEFVNELNKPFLEAYKYSRSKMGLRKPKYGFNEGDMANLVKGKGEKQLTKLIKKARKKKALVGFIGGPPCPDFSVAGKNRGRNGPLGKLSATYTALINKHKPDFFLFENVKGLWKTKSHRKYYEELKKEFLPNGYILTERLINSLEYGVPQDRDRIILVGFQKAIVPAKLLDIQNKSLLKEKSFPWDDFIKYPRKEIFDKYKKVENSYTKEVTRIPPGIPVDTTVEYWFNKNDVTKHPNAGHHFIPRQALPRFKKIKEGDVSRKSYKRLHRWRYSPTVAYGNNEVHLHPVEDRRLSVAEALALQSLPRDFVFPDSMTLSNMFKAISNGVPYVAAKGVANTIKKFLDSL
ncbi:MAG: DNA cytosine methyltransferase [Patescibacteria group bacterium]|nr:DNA cytosine methyltransferase [Patescibacteria group bacterium]